MKKITFLLVFFFAVNSVGYGQCIQTSEYPTGGVTYANTGIAQMISTCNFTSEFASISGLSVGSDYVFTCSTTAGVNKYITITDALNNVIANGDSPLTVTAITEATVRAHFSESAACDAVSSCNITTVQIILTCPTPINMLVDGISTTTANFTWGAGGSETEWEILILPNGDPIPGAGNSGTIVSGTSTFLATALTESTTYQFYVRANCGGGDYSP